MAQPVFRPFFELLISGYFLISLIVVEEVVLSHVVYSRTLLAGCFFFFTLNVFCLNRTTEKEKKSIILVSFERPDTHIC